jgi:hypothetical protein
MLEQAASFPDHFGVVGAFEICADRFCHDSEFEATGTKILDQLFGDMERLPAPFGPMMAWRSPCATSS